MHIPDAHPEKIDPCLADEVDRFLHIGLTDFSNNATRRTTWQLFQARLDANPFVVCVARQSLHPAPIVGPLCVRIRRHDDVEPGIHGRTNPVVLRAFIENEAAGNSRRLSRRPSQCAIQFDPLPCHTIVTAHEFPVESDDDRGVRLLCGIDDSLS